MSATQAGPSWGDPVVRASQAAELGAPAHPGAVAGTDVADAGAGFGRPELAAVAGSAPPEPTPFRLPQSASDQDGMYTGLRWVIRAVEECGRAFTRVSGRVKKAEARLAVLEKALADAGAADAATDSQGPFAQPVRWSAVESRMNVLERRLASLDGDGRPATAVAPSPSGAAGAQVVAMRSDPQVAVLRRELAADRVRIDRLEAQERQPVTAPQAKIVVRTMMAPLVERVGSLEDDVQGVYRELDAVADLVNARFASLVERLDRLAAVEALDAPRPRGAHVSAGAPPLENGTAGVPAPTAGMAVAAPSAPGVPSGPGAPPDPFGPSSLDLTPTSVRAKAASVLSAELERIRHALGVLAEVAERVE